ncbi:MAG: GerAB/ArcD/ProY family transporter [Bacillota bacterium]
MNNELISKQIQERGKISAFQLTLLIITLVLATADVLLPAFVAQEAKQDSWISVIIGTVSALPIINLFLTLGLKYPDKTIVQYTCDILGKFFGKIVGFLYIYFFIFITSAVVRELEEIFVVSFNSDIPISLISIIIVLVAMYSLYGGLEVITRVNDVLLPLGIFVLLFVGFTNIPQMDLHHFLPVLYDGLIPPLKGGLLILTWLLKSIVLLQLIPFVKDKKRIRKNIFIGTIALGNGLLIGVFTIAIFGPITEKLLFPALEYVRFARFGHYIENLDISIMLVWIGGIFINIAVYYYAAVLGLAQLFNLDSYKPMLTPVGVLIVCFSILIAKTLPEIIYFVHYIYPFYIFTIAFIIPALLLFVSMAKESQNSLH